MSRKIGDYWRREWSKYENRLDEALENDSWGSEDHGV